MVAWENVDGEKVMKVKYRPYDLRHYLGDRKLIKNPTENIQSLMGHANIKTTYNVYGHLHRRSASVLTRHTAASWFTRRSTLKLIVAHLWRKVTKLLKLDKYILHGVQGVASSNTCHSDHFKINSLDDSYGKKLAREGSFATSG